MSITNLSSPPNRRPPAATPRAVIIGAGIGGLVSALILAARGLDVVVAERAMRPGGKLRELEVGGARFDAGPTVFTMRWVFDEIFHGVGASLDDHVTLHPSATLARHAWPDGSRLDLFADLDRSADAVGEFAGAEAAAGYRAFSERAERIYRTLERPFLCAQRPTPLGLVQGAGLSEIWGIAPFATLWRALGTYFRDPRLRQLFGRYATYCGASPFAAPATLMLVAHVERAGVWLVEGGMHRLAQALASLATARGARIQYGVEATGICVADGRVSGVKLSSGETLPADAVVVNADPAALPLCFGRDVADAVPRAKPAERSLSALTWAIHAEADGFPLVRHNVFFSADYAAEFADLIDRRRLPASPTLYVCAQDRDDAATGPGGPERLFCLVNAPPTGDRAAPSDLEIEQCTATSFARLEAAGLRIHRRPEATVMTAPQNFARLFPATGGALYGQASHGAMATFRRPGSRTAIPGLYLAGGGTHPGPGVPMAALSGRLAASSLVEDLASTSRSRSGAMPGGISTR